MNWRFWRKPAPPAPEAPKSTEDWAAGDLAQCIIDAPWLGLLAPGIAAEVQGPARGSVTVVQFVRKGQGLDGRPDIGLYLAGHSGWWSATQFVKLRPASEEFIASITAKRKVDA